MERLEAAQRAKIKKMSDEALRQNLSKAGIEDVKLASMAREQLLGAWADITLSEAAAKAPPHVGYDVELEKRRLDFEIRKFEAEEARRREEVELRREEAERQDKWRKEEREREARQLREERFRKEEIDRREELRKEEIDRQD